jgi:hypothetical protein
MGLVGAIRGVAEHVELAVDIAAIGPAEISKRLFFTNGLDVCDRFLRESLCFFSRACASDAAQGRQSRPSAPQLPA